jgi:transcriptional regulator with XRE-family HTH domain
VAPNIALRQARMRRHLSQGELARLIRESGFRSGRSAPCTERTVQRWEAGAVARPQGRYLLALEEVFGQPAENLGFDADRRFGMDRDRMLSDAGLDAAVPLPDPAASYGPLSGIWLSEYEYPSSGRGASYRNRHYVLVLQRGARLMVRSVSAEQSALSMDMSVNGQVVTGAWTEQTEAGGYYGGAVYHGALQFLLDPTGHRMEGEWVGFGRNLKVNHGEWTLTLVEGQVGSEALRRWNRVPERPDFQP